MEHNAKKIEKPQSETQAQPSKALDLQVKRVRVSTAVKGGAIITVSLGHW